MQHMDPVAPPRVPLNDLTRYSATVADRLAAEFRRVCAGGHFVLGPAVAAFESAFAAYCGVAHCVGVANGTDALEIALKACGVVPGDGVLVAANAAMYGTSAALACGAVPVFADVGRHGLLERATLERALQQADGVEVKAVIVTHLYGRLADIAPIQDLCRERGIRLIEDCAQAHGARDPSGVRAGAFGDCATFSFYPTKNLGAIGDAGAVVSNDAGIAAAARQLRQYGWSAKYLNSRPGGRNTRLDEVQAALLSLLLPDLDARNAARQAIAMRYGAEIANPAIELPAVGDAGYVAHLFVVQCDARDRLAAHLDDAGIGSDIHYPVPDHRQPILVDAYGGSDLPATGRWCARALTLPCFPELTTAEVDRVIAACNGFTG